MRISQIRRIRSGNFCGWKIPVTMNPGKAFKDLQKAQYRPVMQKIMENGQRFAIIGVRLAVAPWERGVLETLLREADKIVRKSLER